MLNEEHPLNDTGEQSTEENLEPRDETRSQPPDAEEKPADSNDSEHMLTAEQTLPSTDDQPQTPHTDSTTDQSPEGTGGTPDTAETEPTSEPQPTPETANQETPEPEPETEPVAKPDAEPEPEPEPEPDAQPEPQPEPEPDGEDQIETDANNSKSAGQKVEDRANPEDVSKDLARYRTAEGMPSTDSPENRHTVARLDIGGNSFYGRNGHGVDIDIRVNSQTREHAEAQAFQHAKNDGRVVKRPDCTWTATFASRVALMAALGLS